MSKHRHRSSYSSGSTGSAAGSLLRYVFVLLVLGVAGGITWLALTPMDAPTHEVVRPVADDKLGPA